MKIAIKKKFKVFKVIKKRGTITAKIGNEEIAIIPVESEISEKEREAFILNVKTMCRQNKITFDRTKFLSAMKEKGGGIV